MISIYEKIIKNLNVVLFYKETTILLSIDQNFYNSVSNLINICNYIENNEKLEVKQTPDYILLMESITEKKFIIEELENIDLSNVTNELDNMKIIVKNAIKKDIEEISLILRKELIDKLDKKESDEAKTSNIVEDKTIDKEKESFNNNPNLGTFEQRNASSINQIANSMIEQQAQSLMFMDMNNGKLYRFTSKPKIIPIIKNILLVLVALLAVILLVSSIISLTFSGVNGSIPVFAFISPIVNPYKDMLVLNNPNNIFGNIFIYIGMALIAFSVISSLKKSRSNENIRYSMKISTYIMPVIFFLLISSIENFSISGTVVFSWTKIFNNLDKTGITWVWPNGIQCISINLDAYDRLLAIFVLTIIAYVIIGIIFLLFVVSHNYKPKDDFEKLNSIRQSYINDIKSGKIDMSDPSMFPPPRRFPF